MNVVFDARVVQDHFPGIGRYAFNLLAELPGLLETGEALIVLHDPAARNTRYDLAGLRNRCGKQVMWMEYRRSVFDIRSVLRAPVVPQPNPTVIHYPYYVRPRATRPPSVTTIFDAISFVYPQYVPSLRAQLSIRILHQIAIGASRRIITISQSAARELTRFFPSIAAKLAVVPLAADPAFQPQAESHIAHARAYFDLPPRFALYLGSNKPHKNLVRLIEAWRVVIGNWRLEFEGASLDSPLPSPHSPIPLVIAGHQDPRYPEAQAHARALGMEQWVHFIGSVSDAQAAALYSACDLFVYPSLHEGFGLTVLEAMACGAPVACSNCSSLPEVAGDAALMFDPEQPQAIAEACLRVLHDDALRAQLRARSLEQAARFSWRETARQTMDVYRSAIERARPA
ncbi:MAG: glycosyltransferase family 1 protein [Anaerolineae bacterium]|nr:glycosyltransferase family 4 protein [Candidatus Roseilinea sp.]MDW8450434.1 glycosyltransferase family 1 protein [Anaerolineae bacterium]